MSGIIGTMWIVFFFVSAILSLFDAYVDYIIREGKDYWSFCDYYFCTAFSIHNLMKKFLWSSNRSVEWTILILFWFQHRILRRTCPWTFAVARLPRYPGHRPPAVNTPASSWKSSVCLRRPRHGSSASQKTRHLIPSRIWRQEDPIRCSCSRCMTAKRVSPTRPGTSRRVSRNLSFPPSCTLLLCASLVVNCYCVWLNVPLYLE